MEVHHDGAPVDLGGPRQRAVLARLLAAGGGIVSSGTLIDDLYGDAPPPSALQTLQSYVSNLRRVIEPHRPPRAQPRLLIGRAPGYLLAAADVDAIRFTDLVNRSESRATAEALASLDEALRLCRGTPYGEFSDEIWAVTEVNRLRELRLVAIERRAQTLLDLGRPQALIPDLEVETAANPLRERLWCLLALGLYRTGRQADALAVLRHAGKVLVDQLGLNPGPELRALEADILRQVEALSPITVAQVDLTPAAHPLRGREEQFAKLAALPVHDGLSLATVSGEAGIGKTSLLEAFGDRCADLGHLVLWGRCHDTQGTPALWPWSQVLGALDQCHPAPDRRAMAGLLDDERPTGSTDAALLRRNQAIAQWLAAAAADQPLVIILDDLQWADPASLELLRDVITLLRGRADAVPLTLVTALRDTAFPNESAHDALGRLARYDLLRIRLTGLGSDAVRAVARDMGADMDEEASRRLTDQTGGNPFFVRETARLMVQGHTPDTVPVAVAELVRQRLAGLGPQAGEVLGVAAVIGRDFDPAVVAEVARAEAYHLLDQAVQAGLLVPRATRMAFAHDLVRETLVRDILPLRRAAIHREVMTALSARPGTDVAVIAHHAVQAGPAAYGEAVRWASAAAEEAGLRLAYEEAATWWNLAIKAHDSSAGDPDKHVELLLRQVHALLEAGDAIGARRVRAEAVRAAGRAETGPELTARALTALDAPALWTLRDPYEAVELRLVHRFEIALHELPGADSPLRARLLGGLAQEFYDGSDDPRGHALSARAVAMARRLDDPLLLMQMLNARHLSLPQPLHVPELLKITDEIHELAVRSRMPGFELLAQMMYTHNRLELADLPGADRAAARCEALLERLSLPWPRFQHTLWQANRLALAGRFHDAGALHDQAGRHAERIGVWHARKAVAMGRIAMRCAQGTMAEAGPLVDAIAGVHPTMEHDARILHLCARGDLTEAQALAARGWTAPPFDWSWLSMTCLQGAAQARVGDLTACRETYARLLPYRGRISALSAVACMGPVEWYLTLLAVAMGDRDATGRHLAGLMRLAERNGLTWWRDRAEAGQQMLRRLSAGASYQLSRC
ncbi:BTAD domain-containing putative transcriptional regulator [Streptosporangium sp. NPDC003464]